MDIRSIDELARKLNDDGAAVQSDAKDEKIAKAAAERKKARTKQRTAREFVWEPRSDLPIGFVIAVIVIAPAAVLAVLVTVIWK